MMSNKYKFAQELENGFYSACIVVHFLFAKNLNYEIFKPYNYVDGKVLSYWQRGWNCGLSLAKSIIRSGGCPNFYNPPRNPPRNSRRFKTIEDGFMILALNDIGFYYMRERT